MKNQDQSFDSDKDLTLERVKKKAPVVDLCHDRFDEFLVDLDKWSEKWLEPIILWLQGLADNSVDAYLRGFADFSAYIGKSPDEVTWRDIIAFKTHLLEDVGNAPKTVLNKIGAVSSYFNTLGKPIGPNGDPLVPHNPVDPVDLSQLRAKAKSDSNPTSLDDFVQILDEIDRDIEKGARDWVLLNWITLCAHRRHELAKLKGEDLRKGPDGSIIYEYPLKGSGTKEKVIPKVIEEWLREYLQLSGRSLEGLDDKEGVFISTAANRDVICRETEGDFYPPIDPGAIGYVLKSYARSADGVDPDDVIPHGLRHLGAYILEELSNDPREVQKLLDHQSVATTETYLRGLKEQRYENVESMREFLLDALDD